MLTVYNIYIKTAAVWAGVVGHFHAQLVLNSDLSDYSMAIQLVHGGAGYCRFPAQPPCADSAFMLLWINRFAPVAFLAVSGLSGTCQFGFHDPLA